MALFDQDDRSADEELADAQSDARELTELDEDAEASQSTIRILDASRDFAWELSDPVLGRIKGTDDGNGFGTFELNLDRSLAEQLGRFFDSLETAELTLENIQRIPDGSEGAYALYRGEKLIYVGKSNARRGLKTRLARHRKKLSNRIGISPSEIRFKAAQIFSFSAFNVEALLLLLARERLYKSEFEAFKVEDAQYRAALAVHEGKRPAKTDGTALLQAWKESGTQLRKARPKSPDPKKIKPPELNNSGFGSNDTGVERDTQETSKFDLAYPLDLQSVVDVFATANERQDGKYNATSEASLRQALDWLSRNVCFTFRIDKKSDRSLLEGHTICLDILKADTMSNVMSKLSMVLPDQWRIVAMKGKVLVSSRGGHKDVQAYFIQGGQREEFPNTGNP